MHFTVQNLRTQLTAATLIQFSLSLPASSLYQAGKVQLSPPYLLDQKNAHRELYVNKWPFVYKTITCSLTEIAYLYLASEQNTLLFSVQLDSQSLNKQVTKI